jgi:hypothetical protein
MAWMSEPQIPTSVLRTSTCPGPGAGIGASSMRTPWCGSATARRIGPVDCAGASMVWSVIVRSVIVRW